LKPRLLQPEKILSLCEFSHETIRAFDAISPRRRERAPQFWQRPAQSLASQIYFSAASPAPSPPPPCFDRALSCRAGSPKGYPASSMFGVIPNPPNYFTIAAAKDPLILSFSPRGYGIQTSDSSNGKNGAQIPERHSRGRRESSNRHGYCGRCTNDLDFPLLGPRLRGDDAAAKPG
jgi:hypothetical protein